MNVALIIGGLFLLSETFAQPLSSVDPDAELSVPELITKYHYPCETHQVITKDDYILTLHRIPPHKKDNGKVIFLQHGILSSSADWIILGTEKALAYMLSEEGYDVWMGNSRGNRYSRNHTYLNPDKDSEFWEFSFNEIGKYDIPATVDYALKISNKTKLFYVGHSQGTSSFLVAESLNPEINAKIEAAFLLAPIAYMNHMTSPMLRFMAFFSGPFDAFAKLFGMNEFLPNNDMMARFGDLLCRDGDLFQELCKNVLFVLCGFSNKEMNATLLPVIMGHTPAGASRVEMIHFSQEINSGHFRQYDFGLFENMNKYKRGSPPNYDLKKVTSDVHLFYSHNDWLSALKDVNRLAKQLPNVRSKIIVDDGNFNHLDYMFGKSAKDLVYNKIISLLTRYRN